MKKDVSLKSKIFIIFITMIIISTGTVAALRFANSVNFLTTQSEDKIMLELERNSNYFSQWFDTQKKLLTTFAQEVEIRQLYQDKNSMQSYLAKRTEAYPYILSVYMVTEQNEMIDSTFWTPDEGYDALSRDWYIAAKDTEDVAMIAPYIDSQTKNTIITISKRIMQNNKMIGVMCIDITANNLAEMVKKSSENENSYVFIVDKDNNILMHPDEALAPDADGNIKNLSSLNGYEKLISANKNDDSDMYRFTSYKGEDRFFRSAPIEGSDWRMIVSYTTKNITQRLLTEIVFTLSILTIIFVFSIIIVNLFYKKYIAPIRDICSALDDMSNGNIHVDIHAVIAHSTEMRSLKTSLQNMSNTLQNYITEISSVLTQLSENNFDVNITNDYKGDFTSIKTSLGQIISSLNSTLNRISSVAGNVKSGAQTVSDGANVLSEGVSQQVRSIEEISAKLTDVTRRVVESSQKSESASDTSSKATVAVASSNEQMVKLLDAIKEIHVSSNEIEKIIKTIENIAFQTNILALNAAVEAARAGAAGKGFAVVADEVRNLANKSADAANNTTTLIKNSIEVVNRGVTLANLTASNLDKIVEGAKYTTAVIKEISTESSEQANELASLNDVIDEINSVVHSNSLASNQSVITAAQLTAQAETLDKQVKNFKLRDKVLN